MSELKKPAAPLASATILLLRDGANGIEVFMVKRHHQIDFASGALVFPGGKVDERDRDPDEDRSMRLGRGDITQTKRIAALAQTDAHGDRCTAAGAAVGRSCRTWLAGISR